MLRCEPMDEIVVLLAKPPMPALLDKADVPWVLKAHLLREFPDALNVVLPSAPENINRVFEIPWCCI